MFRIAMLVITSSVFLVSAAPVLAQDEDPGTRLITLTSFTVPPGQASQDFWAVVDKYLFPADKANPHILSERIAGHYFGSGQNVYIITEYEDLAALQKAEEWSDENFDKDYPEGSAARDSADAAFEKSFLPYFIPHEDQILQASLRRVK
jgi:hypothetical protein